MAGHHAESYPYIRSLVEHLNSVRPGSFANGGAFQLPLPALKINGVEGVVGLPANDAQAKAIISVCSQAPYGRGEETIVDTSVRPNTWQLDPAHFTIMNPKWNTGIKNLTTVVERELGCDPSLNVRCELSKFLLYEQGSFFKPHHEEKADGMFGTMVVQLPSDYDGGVLRVCHRGEEMTFDFSGLNGMTEFHYAAFYADCLHELCEVTRGYQMCLVYNLVYSGDGARPVPIDNRQVVNEVVARIRDWEQDDSGLPFVAYLLNYRYCEANLSFQLLNNAKKAIAEVLVEASKQKSFCLYLGTVTLHQVCLQGDGYSCCDMGIDEIESSFEAHSLVSPSGETLDSINLDENTIVPSDVFDGVDPDEEELEVKHNRGAVLNRTYQEEAWFMWPKNHHAIVMGIDTSISELESSCKKLATPGCEPDARQQQECEVMAIEIVAASKNSHGCPSSNAAVTLLACLQQLEAATLTSEFIQAVAVHHSRYLWCRSFLKALIKSCIAFGWEQLEQALAVLFRSLAAKRSCSFLSMLADCCVSSQQLKVCQKLVDIVCHALTSEQDITTSSVRASRSCSTRSQSRSKEFVCRLFKAFSVLQCEDQLNIVIHSFFKQPKRYPLSTTLVPAAIELHQCMDEGSHAPLYSLLSHCVTTLQRSTQEAPTWSNNSDLKCSCELCTMLAAFLKDPEQEVAHYSMKQSKRTHLEHQLAYCSDVTYTTKRISTPHTLVVTKNQQSHEAKIQNYQSRLALLHRVRLLLEQLEKPSKCLKVDDESKPIIIEH